MSAVPSVSVIIPALNEAEDIEGCIDAIAAQDYPLDAIEIIVVDGASSDATVERAGAATGRARLRRLPHRGQPAAADFMWAQRRSFARQGDVIVRIDARSRIEPHYVRTCVEVLSTRPEVGEVGGAQIARPRSERALGGRSRESPAQPVDVRASLAIDDRSDRELQSTCGWVPFAPIELRRLRRLGPRDCAQ